MGSIPSVLDLRFGSLWIDVVARFMWQVWREKVLVKWACSSRARRKGIQSKSARVEQRPQQVPGGRKLLLGVRVLGVG